MQTVHSLSLQRLRLFAVLLKKACGIDSGSGVPNKTKVARITREQITKIAEQKMPDLNAGSLDALLSA